MRKIITYPTQKQGLRKLTAIRGGWQKIGTLTASYGNGYDTFGDRAYVIELYKK
jgi:hypothetical protein